MPYKIEFTILSFFLLGMAFSCNKRSQDPILIATFDDSFDNWSKEGNAFGVKPVAETMGFYGTAHISSLNQECEPATGTLTSPIFKIERDFIHFLLGARETDFMDDQVEIAIELLIEDQVVRLKKPVEFHAMFHYGWDVSEFKGKDTRIRIVDKDERPFVFIDVDHIVQNDIPLEGIVTERIIKVDEDNLNIPIKEGSPRRYFEISVGESQVRAFDASLALNSDIDFWVRTDVSDWSGELVKIKTYQYFEDEGNILDKLVLKDGIVDAENLYAEKLRPQFHFTAKRGWLNDPNGLLYYEGKYHLFYQANPFGNDWSRNDYNKTWGHAVSTNLVEWTELPAAIHPDHLGSIYSGSAVVDHNNTTGFQTGSEKPIVAVYTSAGTRNRWSLGEPFTQSIAHSNDQGRTFTKFYNNPVQENIGYINRDPKAIWYEPDQRWVIVLYLDHGAFVFFTSDDLKSWQRQSTLEIGDFGVTDVAAFEDCPELFELPIDGDPNYTKWVLYAGFGDYVLGDFDGKRFIPETGLIKYNYGDCFYASQTFNNVPKSDGRRIQMAWGTLDFPGMPFNQMMNFPVSLALGNTRNGVRMFANPVREIERLYDSINSQIDVDIIPGENLFNGFKHSSYDIEMNLSSSTKGNILFEANGREIKFDLDQQKIISGDLEIEYGQIVDTDLNIRLLVDIKSIEIYLNKGEIYIPLKIDGAIESESIALTSDVSLNIDELKIRTLRSIWN